MLREQVLARAELGAGPYPCRVELVEREDRMCVEEDFGPHDLLLCAVGTTDSSALCADKQVGNPRKQGLYPRAIAFVSLPRPSAGSTDATLALLHSTVTDEARS